ncbi:MAG: MFS transporter [Streptosporangiales bacterium]
MASPVAGPPSPQATQDADPRRWWALAVMLLAALMDLLDTTIVNVAIPSIQRELETTYATVQWLVVGYVLAFALLLVTGGRLGDVFGRKRVFLAGVGCFTLASLGCGLAPSSGMLVGGRIVQGAAAAVMVPQVLAMVQASFPPAERRRAIGMYAGVGGLATVLGPLVGGLLIRADLFGWGWRPIFLVNVPVGVVTLVLASALVRESRSPDPLRLDPGGVLVLTAGLFALVYPLVQGREQGWPWWSYAMLGACVPVLAGFAWYERWKTRRDNSPLVRLGLFGNRGFAAGLPVVLVYFAGVGAFFLVFVLYLQVGLGFSALHAGVTTIPFSVGTACAAALATRLSGAHSRRALVSGALLSAAGMMAVWGTVRWLGDDITSWWLVPGLLVAGLGMGFALVPVADVVLGDVSRGDEGTASGVLSTMQQVGNAIGVAVVGVIFFGALSNGAANAVDDSVPALRADLSAAHVPSPAADRIVATYRHCGRVSARSNDPAEVPARCKHAGDGNGRVAAAISDASASARADLFDTAFREALWWVAAAFAATLLPMPLLPRTVRRSDAPLV